jgi:hypothetical protein
MNWKLNNIIIPEPVQEYIAQQSPADRKNIYSVLSLLNNVYWRDLHKVDVCAVLNHKEWLIAEGGYTVIFAETDDEKAAVIWINKRSLFDPSWQYSGG